MTFIRWDPPRGYSVGAEGAPALIAICDRCGALVDKQGIQIHDRWHDRQQHEGQAS